MGDEPGRLGNARKGTLQRYLLAIRRFDLLTISGERRLASKNGEEFESARRELVQRNLRLVVRVARSYRSSAVGIDELISEGNLGLIEAARRFDPERKVRFASYAVYWIRKYMLAALHRGTLQATSPASGNSKPGGRGADATGPPRGTRQRILSFEEFMQNSGDREFLECHAIDDALDPEETSLGDDLETALAAVLHKLPPVERTILEAHYGIDGVQARTLREIGEILGFTRERVRQLELRALDRARRLIEAPFRG